MSTASVVAISAILCLLLTLIIASAITLVIVILRIQRAVEVFSRSLDETLSLVMDRNVEHREALVQSLSAHQSELKLLSQSISATLDLNYAKIQDQVRQINGQGIKEAISQFLEAVRIQGQAATRIERAALAIGDLARVLVSESELNGSAIDRARESGLGPESYAPPLARGESDLSRSRTAAGDELDLAEETEDNSFRDH